MHRSTLITLVMGLGLMLLGPAGARASIILDPDIKQLQPDTAGQIIELHSEATEGETITGVDLNVQIGALKIGNGDAFPTITDVDLTGAGTIFDGNNTGESGTGSFAPAGFPSLWQLSTGTSSGAVSADGVLARLTVDTTGYQIGDGPFDLRVVDTLNGDTTFTLASGSTTAIDNGDIVLTPEPTSAALLAIGGLALLAYRPAPRRRMR